MSDEPKYFIQAIGTANPSLYVTGEEALDMFERRFCLAPQERALYRRILIDGPVRGRFVGMSSLEDSTESNPDRLVERFLAHGALIAEQAACKAMDEAGCSVEEIGGVVVNTCTGYLCPGLSSYIVEKLGLGSSVRVMDLMGMGCGAAVPNLECSAGLLARGLRGAILSIAVEVCSATLFMGPEPDLVISNSIFGDGASAAIIRAGRNGERNGLLHLVDFESGVFPGHRDQLRYRTEKGRLRNVLSRRVPILGGEAVAQVTQRLLARNGLSVGQIDWWAVHPGGTAVLKQVGRKLGLGRDALHFSYEVFREYGNMSSPSIMFVLRRIIDEGRPEPGQTGLLLSFGAGFTAFGALVVF